MKPLKPGVHRLVARDGTVGLLVVAEDGRLVDLGIVGKAAPPPNPSRRWVGRSVGELRAHARRRRIDAALERGDVLEIAHLLLGERITS